MVAVYIGVGDVSGSSDGAVVRLSAEVGTVVGNSVADWQAVSANAREIKMVGIFTGGIIAVECTRSKIHLYLLDQNKSSSDAAW